MEMLSCYFDYNSIEMSKEYKVHENFELEHLSWDDENCHCNSPGKNYN